MRKQAQNLRRQSTLASSRPCYATLAKEALGHDSIKTTLLYGRCILPAAVVSPLDRLRQRQREAEVQAPETTTLTAQAEADKQLFEQPLSVQAIELPFRDPSDDTAGGFYRLLKTLITGRFLAWSRLIKRSG